MMKKLYKSKENKVFFGVIGGIGERFNIDPVILRLIWVAVVIFTALVPGIIVYLIASFIVPNKP
ncbi:PspC domain-containing protein [Patescibacteria group bacterium]|nr:PspC domain-containing protein [Patescibacteria group bacterium]